MSRAIFPARFLPQACAGAIGPPCGQLVPGRVVAGDSKPASAAEQWRSQKRPGVPWCVHDAPQRCGQPHRQCGERDRTLPAPADASRQQPREPPQRQQPGRHPEAQRQPPRQHVPAKPQPGTPRSSSERDAHVDPFEPAAHRRNEHTHLGPQQRSYRKQYRTCDIFGALRRNLLTSAFTPTTWSAYCVELLGLCIQPEACQVWPALNQPETAHP